MPPDFDFCYDTLDHHIGVCSDLAQASVPMGMMLAWGVNMHLVSPAFQHEFERDLLRVRMRELRGSELLIAAGGDLCRSMFNSGGQSFLDAYYDQYLDDFDAALGARYGVQDDWHNYSTVAKVVTRHYMGLHPDADRRSVGGLGVWSKLRKWFTSSE